MIPPVISDIGCIEWEECTTTAPEINFEEKLFCPYCGEQIWPVTDIYCQHLVFKYLWGADQGFDMIRKDYARAFVQALKQSGYTLSETTETKFLTGDIQINDPASREVDCYLKRFPDKLFPQILPINTIIYRLSSYPGSSFPGGIRIAVSQD